MEVALLLIKQILEYKVQHVFGIPGNQLNPILAHLHNFKSQVKFITSRHENGAVLMAEGYVQGTNNGAICFLSPGPGMANAVNGLSEAYHTRSPILVITVSKKNTIQLDRSKLFHGLDHAKVFESVVNEYIYIDDKDQFQNQLGYAFHQIFVNKTGPVLVEFDQDLLSMNVIPAKQFKPQLQMPNVEDIKNTIIDTPEYGRIKSRSRGVLVVGRKTALFNSGEAVKLLAEACGFPVIMTTAGKGAIDETGYYYFDIIKEKRAFDLINESEIAVFIGVDLNEIDTWDWTLSVKGIVVSVFSDLNFKMHCEAFYVIPGKSMEDSINKLRNNCFTGHMTQSREDFHGAAVRETKNEHHRIIAETMHEKVSVVNDVHLTGFGIESVIRSKYPYSFLYSHLAFNLGYGLPVAIGLKFARVEQRVVLFCGDGGFLLSMPELATLLKYELPLLIILINDYAYGTIKRKQQLSFNATIGSTLTNPDFGKLADAYNIESTKVTNIPDFEFYYQRELKSNRTFLIEYLKQEE